MMEGDRTAVRMTVMCLVCLDPLDREHFDRYSL